MAVKTETVAVVKAVTTNHIMADRLRLLPAETAIIRSTDALLLLYPPTTLPTVVGAALGAHSLPEITHFSMYVGASEGTCRESFTIVVPDEDDGEEEYDRELTEGESDGITDGASEGTMDGASDGTMDGASEGTMDGLSDGTIDGKSEVSNVP